MAKVKKMAFGGIGRALKNAVKPAAKPMGGVGPRQGGMPNFAKPYADKMSAAANAANAAKQQAMAANAANAAKQQAMAANAANAAKQRAMAAGAPPRGPVKQANPSGMGMSYDTSALNKISQAKAQAKPMSGVGPRARPGAGIMRSVASAAKKLGLGMKSGGAVGSASKRADGIATKGKTKGKMI
jgi:hypothetical protein